MLQATTTGTFQVSPPLAVRDAVASSNARIWNSALLPALATVLLPLLVFYLLVQYWETVVTWGSWGYLGVFLAELANSAVILVPTPGPAYAFAMGVALDPLSLGLIGGVAATLGELTGYMLGARGRHIVEGGRRYERFKALTMRWTGGGALHLRPDADTIRCSGRLGGYDALSPLAVSGLRHAWQGTEGDQRGPGGLL